MSNRILVDANFLIAANDITDQYHVQAINYLAINKGNLVVPQVVLAESAYILDTFAGEIALLKFWDSLFAPDISLEPISIEDLKRATEIRLQYDTARIDFADCCIMALSERLNITQVCTFDQRHYRIFRPAHCEYLELLP